MFRYPDILQTDIFIASRHGDRRLASFRQEIEIATASLEHPLASQFFDNVEHILPFSWFVACCLE
jgi:hypothetical protein